MKQLRTGTNLIRLLLAFGVGLSLTGLLTSAFSLSLNGTYISILFALNILALVSVLWILITRRLAERVKNISVSMNNAAEGNLKERVACDGETEISLLAENFNSMMDRLSGAISKVHLSLAELRNVSATIADLSEKGVSSADTQSEVLKRTTTSIREINQSISDISASVMSLSALSTRNSNSMTDMSLSLNASTHNLEMLIQSVEEVSSSIMEMAYAICQIEENAAVLTSDTSIAASMVVEMDKAIKQIGIQASDTTQIADTVMTDAKEGWNSVEATITGIKEIKSSSNITFDAIENLSKRVANIGKILSVIDEVAEQTNLLALNASIIAAQAGDKGKSFSVVAGEIKELAKRTGNHTREISEIILGVKEETARAVNAIAISEKKISEGSDLSRKSGEALKKIVNGIQIASDQMVGINKTALSQAEASTAVQRAMSRVADMVEQIARSTQEQSHSSALITSAVDRMRSITGEVKQSVSSHQASASQVITASENINAMVRDICEESMLQSESAKRISESLKDFEDSNEVHVTSTKVMDEVLIKLARQIELLQNEMSRFKA